MKGNIKAANFVRKFGMPLFLLLLVLVLAAISGEANLLAWENLKAIILQASVLGFLALGLSFVMIAGETDISFAGTMGMMSAIFTMLAMNSWNFFAALFVIIIIGAAIGFLISQCVTRGGFSGFIISIAVMFLGLGIERSFNEGVTIWLKREEISRIGRMEFAGIYLFGWILIVMFAAAYVVVRRTKYGFHLRIIGENPAAGWEAGVNTGRIKTIAFVIAGVMYAVAGMAEPIRYGGAIVGAGENYMLPALAACYLGSTMFFPGRVNIAGTMVGSLFMVIISNFMQLLSFEFYFTPLVQGIVLMIAVGISVAGEKGKIQQVKI